MSKVVLDASALFALLDQEKGADKVKSYINQSVMSSVNYAETIMLLLRSGHSLEQAETIIKSVLFDIIDFNSEQAQLAAVIRVDGKHCGISLGDSACLALAVYLNVPVLTADTVWKKLKLDLDIIFIR